MACVLVALALLQQPETDPTKAFIDAIGRYDEPTATKQLAAIAAPDVGESVSRLAEAYREATKTYAGWLKEEIKLQKELDDAHERAGGRGKTMEEYKAEQALIKCRNGVALMDDFIPRICLQLNSYKSDTGIQALIAKAKSAPDWYFRAHAVAALARVESARPTLIEQLKTESDAGVKVALLDALLPHVKTTAGLIDVYVEAVKDPNWQVKIAALAGVRAAVPKSAVPQLIAGMKDAGDRVEWEINETLKAITDINKHNWEAWDAWWKKHGDDFRAGTYVPSPAERAASKGGSTLYGLQIHSSNLIIMIDLSTSMAGESKYKPDTGNVPWTGTNRLDTAKFELKNLVGQLRGGVKFNICVFNNKATFYSPKMTVLDDAKKKALVKWIDELKWDSGSRIWDGLRESFEHGGTGAFNNRLQSGSFDTAVLITDGEPSGRVVYLKHFLEKTDALNRFKKVAIHCIAIEPARHGEDFMKALAAQNQGGFIRK